MLVCNIRQGSESRFLREMNESMESELNRAQLLEGLERGRKGKEGRLSNGTDEDCGCCPLWTEKDVDVLYSQGRGRARMSRDAILGLACATQSCHAHGTCRRGRSEHPNGGASSVAPGIVFETGSMASPAPPRLPPRQYPTHVSRRQPSRAHGIALTPLSLHRHKAG